MWLLINNTLEKIDNLKPLTIHLLLRYTEGIAFDLLKLGKASKISGDLRRSPEIVVSLRKYSEVIRATSSETGKCSGDLRKSSEGFVWSSVIFVKVFVRSSEGFARSSAVFEIHRLASGSLRFNFGYLRCNLHFVTLFCTVLTKNALLFSQSEPSNFFKCIKKVFWRWF